MTNNQRGKLPFTTVLLRFGVRRLPGILWAVVREKPRSLSEDAQRVVSLMNPPPRVEGLHLVPSSEPFVLVANHFQAPGFWVGWSTAAIMSAVADAREPGRKEIHWLVNTEWRLFEIGDHWVANPVSSLIFPRAIRVWGLIPTPARPSDVAGRAHAVRQILTHLKRGRGSGSGAPEPIGLFPEGHNTLALGEALPGTGAFLHHIGRLGIPLLPVGVFQEDGALIVRFGETFSLGDPPPDAGQDLDGWARLKVMVSIGRLLPKRLQGFYSEAIAEADSQGRRSPAN